MPSARARRPLRARRLVLAALLMAATVAALLRVGTCAPGSRGSVELPKPPAHAAATGRFALHRHDGDGWVLHRPDGSPTFLLALNHLVRPHTALLQLCRSYAGLLVSK